MDITRCAFFFIYLYSCSLTDLQQPSFTQEHLCSTLQPFTRHSTSPILARMPRTILARIRLPTAPWHQPQSVRETNANAKTVPVSQCPASSKAIASDHSHPLACTPRTVPVRICLPTAHIPTCHSHARTQSRPHISPLPSPYYAHTQSRPHISPLPSSYYAHTQSHSRTHAKDRLRTLKHLFESYDELNKYLATVESPLQMPVLASSAFLETQAVISSLPPSQHNFSKNTPLSLPIPPLP
jgi:hypothetical protein